MSATTRIPVDRTPPAERMPRGRQRGFTLIELMIALLIGLFLVGGLLTLVGAMKRTSGIQTNLSQLQDSERLAMSLMTDVIQSAGYYPDPAHNTMSGELPINAQFPQQCQSITGLGAGNAAAPGDQISVRYATSGIDNVLDCSGNTQGAAATIVNQFGLDANGNLQCSLSVNGGAAQLITLVSGLQDLQILYGVQSNAGSGNTSVDAYLDADQVTAGGYWGNVISVQVTLTFVNPLFGQPGQASTVVFRRVIDVMGNPDIAGAAPGVCT